jgi:hypothetical protein
MFRRRNRIHVDPPMQLHAPTDVRRGDPDSHPDSRRDLVIGAISGYSFRDIQYWVNSLDRSGFSGQKVVICYAADFDVVETLNSRGYHVITFAAHERRRRFHFPRKGFHHADTSIDRFHQLWRFLDPRRDDYRFVIAADVRDVIFQSDPSAWLEQHLGGKKINVGSEGFLLGDEPWNRDVMLKSYGPLVLEKMRERQVYNAGTIAGCGAAIADLALSVFLCSRHNRVKYTDQTAMNVLLSLEPYRSVTRFNRADDDWACQAATMADPNYSVEQSARMQAPRPVLHDDEVRTADGRTYCLVHQYDRVREWNEPLRRRYADR